MSIGNLFRKVTVDVVLLQLRHDLQTKTPEEIMSKWWPTISVIIGGILTAVTPTIQHALGAHPLVSTIIGTIAGIALHLTDSPTSK